MSGHRVRWAVVFAVGVLLAGCAETDPYLKPGQWQPTGANALNLAAMAAHPHDLIHGHGETRASGAEATPPVTHLWAGKPATLPFGGSQAAPTPAGAAPTNGPGGT